MSSLRRGERPRQSTIAVTTAHPVAAWRTLVQVVDIAHHQRVLSRKSRYPALSCVVGKTREGGRHVARCPATSSPHSASSAHLPPSTGKRTDATAIARQGEEKGNAGERRLAPIAASDRRYYPESSHGEGSRRLGPNTEYWFEREEGRHFDHRSTVERMLGSCCLTATVPQLPSTAASSEREKRGKGCCWSTVHRRQSDLLSPTTTAFAGAEETRDHHCYRPLSSAAVAKGEGEKRRGKVLFGC
nr:hypothetical protein Iba_chr09cCG11350 [Ipomoea batatas]